MREKTSSITQLVKIIAKEEVLKILKEKNEYPKNVINANEYWNNAEDNILKVEFSNAIKLIAYRHGRSCGVIISRLHQKEIY